MRSHFAAATGAAALALRGRPLAAGVLGAVAAAARPTGVLIALPLAWLAAGRGLVAWLGAALPVAAAAAAEGFWASRQRDRLVAYRAAFPGRPELAFELSPRAAETARLAGSGSLGRSMFRGHWPQTGPLLG